MTFFVVGVDHKSCPITIREAITLDAQASSEWIQILADCSAINEVAVLSTCARTEVVLWCDRNQTEALEVVEALFNRLAPDAASHVSVKTESLAVTHIFRVMAGLESQVVGETEIVGQARAAANQARALHTLGPNLDALFRAATACARRLRGETSLGSINNSVATATATKFRQMGDVRQSKVLVIGSGRIARMTARAFCGANQLVMSTRTLSTLQSLAPSVGASTLPLPEAMASLHNFDVVICATASRRPLITAEALRNAAPLVVFDLSIPRNVETPESPPRDVFVFDIDDVQTIGSIREDAGLVESILAGEVRDFTANQSVRLVGPIIASLRDHVDRVRLTELQRVRGRLTSMDANQRETVELLTNRMIDQMFHHLVVRLRLAAITDPELLRAAEFFFAHGEDSIFPAEASQQTQMEKLTHS